MSATHASAGTQTGRTWCMVGREVVRRRRVTWAAYANARGSHSLTWRCASPASGISRTFRQRGAPVRGSCRAHIEVTEIRLVRSNRSFHLCAPFIGGANEWAGPCYRANCIRPLLTWRWYGTSGRPARWDHTLCADSRRVANCRSCRLGLYAGHPLLAFLADDESHRYTSEHDTHSLIIIHHMQFTLMNKPLRRETVYYTRWHCCAGYDRVAMVCRYAPLISSEETATETVPLCASDDALYGACP